GIRCSDRALAQGRAQGDRARLRRIAARPAARRLPSRLRRTAADAALRRHPASPYAAVVNDHARAVVPRLDRRSGPVRRSRAGKTSGRTGRRLSSAMPGRHDTHMQVSRGGRARPPVSVLVVNYNSGRYLADAVRGLAAQSWSDFEAIIVDNASTDG